MPSRILARLALIAGLVVLPSVAVPETEVSRGWLVIVTFPGLPADADPTQPEGRFDIHVAGRFVGCGTALVEHPTSTEVRIPAIVPLGYAVVGRKADIRVKAYDELERVGGMTVTFKPLDGPAMGLGDPR